MVKFQLSSGDLLYKYRLLKPISDDGCFGDVWLANDNAINKPLAIKIIDTSRTSIDEKLLEAQIGNRMDHDNLVRVHAADVVTIDGKNAVVIAMDYLEDGSICSKANAGNFVDIPIATKAVTDILRGLEFLHDAGFYHNDIKPRNILLGPRGEAVLTDYGISEATKNGQAIKPKFFYFPHKAPETFDHNLIDRRTDIYQVGITLFRLVNGINLVSDTVTSYTEDHCRSLIKDGNLLDAAGWQPFVPNSLKRVIKKATDCDISKRYNSALEMRRALEGLLFPGGWTCLPTGELLGCCRGYNYRFEIISAKKHRFVAYKTNLKSGRETKISAFSEMRLTKSSLENVKKRFMKAVVEGKA